MSKSIPQIDLVQAGGLAPYRRVLRQIGASVEPLFKACHIPIAAIEDPEAWVAKVQVHALAARAATSTDTPELGTLAGEELRMDDLGRFGAAVARASTLNKAGQAAQRMIGSLTTGADCWVEINCENAWFCYRTSHRLPLGGEQTEQFDLSMLLKFVRLAAGPEWTPGTIRIATCPTETLQKLPAYAGATIVRDGTVTAIGFPTAILHRPIPRGAETDGANPPRGNPPPDDTFSGTISHVIESLNPHLPVPNLRLMAEMLQMHPRQLQRLLGEENSSYSKLAEQVRYRVACRLLKSTGLPIKEIAFRIGYSGTNNFTRAFQRLAGVSPTVFRRSQER